MRSSAAIGYSIDEVLPLRARDLAGVEAGQRHPAAARAEEDRAHGERRGQAAAELQRLFAERRPPQRPAASCILALNSGHEQAPFEGQAAVLRSLLKYKV